MSIPHTGGVVGADGDRVADALDPGDAVARFVIDLHARLVRFVYGAFLKDCGEKGSRPQTESLQTSWRLWGNAPGLADQKGSKG